MNEQPEQRLRTATVAAITGEPITLLVDDIVSIDGNETAFIRMVDGSTIETADTYNAVRLLLDKFEIFPSYP